MMRSNLANGAVCKRLFLGFPILGLARSRKKIAGALVAATAFFISANSAFAAQLEARGTWGRAGFTIDGKAAQSPDGTQSLRGTPNGIAVIGNTTKILSEVLSPLPLTEVLWSPNSRMFVVNGSDGGVVGEWKAHFYKMSPDGLPVARDIGDLIAPHLRGFAQCDEDNPYTNYGAAAWLDDGKYILVVAEVPPRGTCQNMGALLGFRISVSAWEIVEQISETSLRTQWARFLGSRFAEKQMR